jgi:pantoate--beta-alanine ligase
METFRAIDDLRAHLRTEKQAGRTVAFVPTMGGLHEGHKSCIDIARRLGDVLVVSIFVNPTQFGPTEDLNSYPTTEAADLNLCAAAGCDAVLMPAVEEMYPFSQAVWVDPGPLAAPLCGRTRRNHFRGVTTVVAKLFHVVEPDVAVFGQKDAQQALVIRHMVEQLNMPVRLALSPVVRGSDGLACSSRNRYLSRAEREQATAIYRGLCAGRETAAAGETDPRVVVDAVRSCLAEAQIDDVEYIELLDAVRLEPVDRVAGKLLVAVAARVGTTRLIDNIVLNVAAGGRVTETLLFE